MPITLSTAIMHAPWSDRRPWVDLILTQLPRAMVIEDHAKEGVWPTAKRAWLSFGQVKSTHHLVLQDDAELCDDFVKWATKAIVSRPLSPITFFTSKLRPALSAVAVCLPSRMIPEWLDWTENQYKSVLRHDDMLLNRYLKHIAVPLLATDPSLVNHRDGPSLLGHGSICVDKFEQSPTSIGWRSKHREDV